MNLTQKMISIGLLFSLISGVSFATDDNDKATLYSDAINYEKQDIEESLTQDNSIESDYNALAEAIENSPQDVIKDVAEGTIVDKFGAAGVWFLMKSYEYQIDYIEKFKSLSEQEDAYDDKILIAVNGIFGASGMAMMIPATLE